ncbi:Ribosomal protein L14p/L23e family protein (apicoplast) [Babesia bovis T2Bo]|uniref:Rpl14 n=1 Tax=Babesia bovis TaxID=5865 RepID=A7AXG7_BABBO|nr:Ribosomal protein L14p/L23e family protein [Babesia bovis T2Bo]EDO05090.1 Ribosomal protein L14p/L23e family protein [Babesia bovis T2Bo]|eukprot:YP_002290870.1 rpl14 (apicoplast) [Babesia bovis T2Bo]
MINIHTVFKPSDNSGFKKAKCLGSLGNVKKLHLNSICISVVKSCKKKSRLVRKSDIIKTLVTHTKIYNFNKYRGVKFHNNSLILLNKKYSTSYSIDDRNRFKDTSSIKLIGIIPTAVLKNLIKFKTNLKKAIFI